ncbi:MAG: sulfite exporter TauE/SafE family protein [Candidatus Saccharimonadales bacterium]
MPKGAKTNMKDLLLLAIGLIAGTMNALGGGGSLIAFPVLLAAGLPAIAANATIDIVILPGQLASAFGYRKFLRKLPRKYLFLLLPLIIGSAIGATVLRHTSNDQFSRLVPYLIAVAVLLFAFQPLLHKHLHQHIKHRKKSIKPLVYISLVLLPIAFYGGFFLAGLGFLMLAFLGFTSLDDMHQMNALKNLANIAIVAASIITLASGDIFDWHYGLVMAGGNLFGGYFGAQLAQKIPTRAVRIFIIFVGIAAAAYIAFRHY